jgi:hypothetical protein
VASRRFKPSHSFFGIGNYHVVGCFLIRAFHIKLHFLILYSRVAIRMNKVAIFCLSDSAAADRFDVIV